MLFRSFDPNKPETYVGVGSKFAKTFAPDVDQRQAQISAGLRAAQAAAQSPAETNARVITMTDPNAVMKASMEAKPGETLLRFNPTLNGGKGAWEYWTKSTEKTDIRKPRVFGTGGWQ